jgi:hypothetical protein
VAGSLTGHLSEPTAHPGMWVGTCIFAFCLAGSYLVYRRALLAFSR